jgi:3-oxoacyl-[acyl-carrier protein] reductase
MCGLKDKAVIVTGAAHGIGKAIALLCAQNGAVVLACDRDQKGLNSLSDDAMASSIGTYYLDVSVYEQVWEFFDTIDREKKGLRLYGLVNNAGIYLGKNILEYSSHEIDAVINVNIKGAFYFSQFFGSRIMASDAEGVIVNIASIAGQEGSSDAVYGLSKAALIGLTKSCAMNFAPKIRVNAVAPTIVETKMMKKVPQTRLAAYQNKELILDPVSAEDVAETVLFLLNKRSKHYTGTVFDLNNGGYLH